LTITVGAAAKVAFTTQPSGSTGGVAFGTQPSVSVQDVVGNTVTTDTSNVLLVITGAPGGVTLACTPSNTHAAAAGVATFVGCNINTAGTYTLTASDGALTTAASSSVVITVGAAAKVAFTTQPSSSTGGVAFATQPVVTVQDLGGNTVVGNTSAVTLTLTVAAGGTLTCTANPQAAVAGVATFAGCKIDLQNPYTLTATDGSLTTAISSSLTISVGAAAKLVVLNQPVGATAGSLFATQPSIRVTDLGGNTVTTDVSNVLLAVKVPGAESFTCTANPKPAIAGVANFAGCSINLAGTYVLHATDGVLTVVDTASLTMS
jgi:hypothetical protein